MSASARARPRLDADWFERLYAADGDPWDFATSEYEAGKYRRTLEILGDRRFARALEVGCSIGVFTAQLAARCDKLVAIDVSARALAAARERLAGDERVELRRAMCPEQTPPGDWDLVVCAEVLYYLDRPAFDAAVQRLAGVLSTGATVVAAHWRPATATYPLRGDEVHDLLAERLGRWHACDRRAPLYRLDRFDGL